MDEVDGLVVAVCLVALGLGLVLQGRAIRQLQTDVKFALIVSRETERS
jgi:hypothetical protein